MAVQTEHSKVCTKTSKGKYSPAWLEQAKLESELLHSTQTKLVDLNFSDFHSKNSQLKTVSVEMICFAKFVPSKSPLECSNLPQDYHAK